MGGPVSDSQNHVAHNDPLHLETHGTTVNTLRGILLGHVLTRVVETETRVSDTGHVLWMAGLVLALPRLEISANKYVYSFVLELKGDKSLINPKQFRWKIKTV